MEAVGRGSVRRDRALPSVSPGRDGAGGRPRPSGRGSRRAREEARRPAPRPGVGCGRPLDQLLAFACSGYVETPARLWLTAEVAGATPALV